MQTSNVASQPYNLPQQFTSFIGREQELAEINQRLVDPACRLLTLMGPGGIGKTRLAIQATAVAASHFSHGAYFVNLQPVKTEEFLLTAVADALDISLSSQEPPLSRICRQLANKNLLLTLDNFEQILDISPVLSDLLSGTRIKILVTSRETLNLQEEWLYPLGGMSYPTSHPAPDGPDAGEISTAALSTYSAVQLFVDRARRVRPDFSLEREAESVSRICQMVEGMPLALELAAPWLKSLSCHEIAAEIEHNREFLTSRLRNMPERHRSLQAIFSQTWTGLNEEEQAVFQRLAVFRGGFLRDAAIAVTSASLSLLSTLLDKSLLRWETGEGGNGRYQIHEILRQFAAEKLAADPAIEAETRVRHAHYFAAFVADRTNDLLGGRQMEAMHEIEAELNNVRAAWQWVIDHREAQLLFSMGAALNPFYWYQSRFREAKDAFTAAVFCLESCPSSPERDLILAATLTNQAWFVMVAGDNEWGRQLAERALDLYKTLDQPPVAGLDTDPRLILGIIDRHSDRVPEALVHLHNAAAEAETRPNPINRQCAHRLLAQTYHILGRLELAEEHGRIAYELADRQNDLWGAAYNQDTMGRIALSKSDFETAAHYLQAGYALHDQLRFAQGIADMCLQLADLYLSQDDAAQAEKYAAEGLALYQKSETLHAIVAMETRLAHAQLLAQELEKARIHLLTAADMGIDHETEFPDILFYLLIVAADLVWRIDQGLTGLRWLAAAVSAPQLWSVHEQYAGKLLDRWQISPDSPAWETAVHQTTSFTLADGLAEIMSVFAASLDETTPEIEATAEETAVAANQSLLEPLTNRELEVLQLIATGLSNQQIAEELIISIGTVKYYTSHIYGKLQVPSRTQAIVYARELGILP